MRVTELDLRSRYFKVIRWMAIVLLLLVCLCYGIQAQEAQAVHIHFSFAQALSPRFTDKVVNDLSAALADLCRNSPSLGHWTYDVKAQGAPRIEVSVFARSGSYHLAVALDHGNTATALPDHWETELFSPEYVTAHGLPMGQNWMTPIQRTFGQMLPANSKSGKELYQALQALVPLGHTVVMIKPNISAGQPASVLPLPWDRYQDIATCHFRLLFHQPSMLITLHAFGTGGALDFTPDAPQYKAVWVIYEQWQTGGGAPVDIGAHLAELPNLTGAPSEIYLEGSDCTPAGVSIANN